MDHRYIIIVLQYLLTANWCTSYLNYQYSLLLNIKIKLINNYEIDVVRQRSAENCQRLAQ